MLMEYRGNARSETKGMLTLNFSRFAKPMKGIPNMPTFPDERHCEGCKHFLPCCGQCYSGWCKEMELDVDGSGCGLFEKADD